MPRHRRRRHELQLGDGDRQCAAAEKAGAVRASSGISPAALRGFRPTISLQQGLIGRWGD